MYLYKQGIINNHKIKNMKKYTFIVVGSALVLCLFSIAPAMAAGNRGRNSLQAKRPSITGSVTAINGNSIVILAKNGLSYTVDASKAKIMKAGTAVQIANVQVSDKLFVKGIASGTSVVALVIIDSLPIRMGKVNQAVRLPKGNLSFGIVNAINGSSFTLQTKNKSVTATSTVNTDSNTTFKKNGQAALLSDLAVGQHVLVSGPKDSTTNIITAANVNIVTITTHSGRGMRKVNKSK